MFPDLRRLADDDACAMVDHEILADGRTGVDIDSRLAMGELRHDAWDDWHLHLIQHVRKAINGNCIEPRIGKDDLVGTLCRRIAIKNRGDIGGKIFANRGNLLKESQRDLLGLFAYLRQLAVIGRLTVAQCDGDLFVEPKGNIFDHHR